MPQGLIIALGAVAVLLLLLVIPVKITVCYKARFTLTVSYLFLVFQRFPEREKKPRVRGLSLKKLQRKKRKAKRRALRAQKKQAGRTVKGAKKRRLLAGTDIEEQFNRLRLWLPPILRFAGQHMTLRTNRFRITVGSEDAARTAMLYGTVSQGVAYLLELFGKYVRVRRAKDNVHINADFTAETTTADVKLVLTMSALSALRLLLRVALDFLKHQLKNTVRGKHDTEKEG